jgi:calcineurin-like phosphoesterase family protein
VPAMANAIRSAGLTPREYSKISLVMFQAMMVHGFQKAAANKELPKEFAGSVLAENIKFVADNEAEITRLLERMKMEKKGS